jgi:hypothetical protein
MNVELAKLDLVSIPVELAAIDQDQLVHAPKDTHQMDIHVSNAQLVKELMLETETALQFQPVNLITNT